MFFSKNSGVFFLIFLSLFQVQLSSSMQDSLNKKDLINDSEEKIPYLEHQVNCLVREVSMVTLQDTNHCCDCKLSSDKKYILMSSISKSKICCIKDKKIEGYSILPFIQHQINYIAIDSLPYLFFTDLKNQALKLWDINNKKIIYEIPYIRNPKFSNSGRYFIAYDWQDICILYNIQHQIRTVMNYESIIDYVWHPKEDIIFLFFKDSILCISALTGEIIKKTSILGIAECAINQLQFSHTGNFLILIYPYLTVKGWVDKLVIINLNSKNTAIATITINKVKTILFPDNKEEICILDSEKKSLHIYNLETLQLVRTIEYNYPSNSIQKLFTLNGLLLIVIYSIDTQNVGFLNYYSGKLVAEFQISDDSIKHIEQLDPYSLIMYGQKSIQIWDIKLPIFLH